MWSTTFADPPVPVGGGLGVARGEMQIAQGELCPQLGQGDAVIFGQGERFVGVGPTFRARPILACNQASPASDIARSVVWPVSLARAMLSS